MLLEHLDVLGAAVLLSSVPVIEYLIALRCLSCGPLIQVDIAKIHEPVHQLLTLLELVAKPKLANFLFEVEWLLIVYIHASQSSPLEGLLLQVAVRVLLLGLLSVRH